MKNCKTLIVTGFHRSATSATANYLLNSGLDLGDDLMCGDMSNPKGHFEDWWVVKAHDSQLKLSGTDWQFSDECELECEDGFLAGYIARRSQNNRDWGIKDPRACLFLPEWEQALGESGFFLFVIRHWASCFESLLRRHSRKMTCEMRSMSAEDTGIQFWRRPELAAKMWLSYNQRILAFAKSHPNKVMLVSQRALFEGADFIDSLNTTFGFSLNATATAPFEPHLLHDYANKRIFTQLSQSLQRQLDAVWQELLNITSFKSTNEEPSVVVSNVHKDSVAKIYDTMSQTKFSLSGMDNNGKTVSSIDWLASIEKVTDGATIQNILKKSSLNQLQNIETRKWLGSIERQFSLDGDVILSVANLLFRIKEYRISIEYFAKASLLGVYPPYVDMNLGQCWQNLEEYEAAEHFFVKAINRNPNNPVFYTKYSQLLLLLGRVEEAETYLKLGVKQGLLADTIIPYCEFLKNKKRGEELVVFLKPILAENPPQRVKDWYAHHVISEDLEKAEEYHRLQLKERLQNGDFARWIVDTCGLIDCGVMEKDFIVRCLEYCMDDKEMEAETLTVDA